MIVVAKILIILPNGLKLFLKLLTLYHVTCINYHSDYYIIFLVICMGLPQVIVSDNGTEFHNKLDRQLAEHLWLKRRLTTPYHPQFKCPILHFHNRQTGLLNALTSHRSQCLLGLFIPWPRKFHGIHFSLLVYLHITSPVINPHTC